MGIVAARSSELNASGNAAETMVDSIWGRAVGYPEVVLPTRAWIAGRTEKFWQVVDGTEAVRSADVMESAGMFFQMHDKHVVEWTRSDGVGRHRHVCLEACAGPTLVDAADTCAP